MAQVNLPPIFLADIGEVLGAIITLGVIIFWVIQKIAEANKAMQNRPARPPAPVAAQGGGRPAGQQADPLRSQVEEFLRRANQGNPPKQGAPQARKPVKPAREVELLIGEEPPPPERRPVGSTLGASQSRPTVKAVPAAAPFDQRAARRPVTPRKRKSLAERADERAAARTKAIAQKVSNLGQRIITDDREFDDQLKAKFDHVVGTLAANTVSEVELVPVTPDTPAAQIAAMLANPDGVRQAIILNEVLSQPTDRW